MSAPVFRTSGIDPRRLTQPAHEIARQTHGERRRIHGPILPMAAHRERVRAADRIVAALGLATAAFCILYFAAQLLRGWQ